MDRYAVVGHPVEHSRSPAIHAAFARQTHQDIDYTRVQVPLDGFAAAVAELAQGGLRGCNVTVPFKFEAFALARGHSERAALAQAANVLRLDVDGYWGDNSDGIGLVRDIEGHAGVSLRGVRVLLLGAGGAAAGVLGPLIEAGPAELVVANRSLDRADLLVERHLALARRHGVALRAAPLRDCGRDHDVLINGTAASLVGVVDLVHDHALAPGALALDMMYGAAARPFLAWARERGAHGRDGLGMLVEQAAEAFVIWRGVRPDTRPVLAELRALVDAT
jgi:shikimate dehydrogenase